MSKHDAGAPRPHKKGRVLKCLLALVLVLAVMAAAAVLAVRREIHGSGTTGQAVTVEVAQGSSVAAIAGSLQQVGMIRFPQLFRWYVGYRQAESRLQYGSFTLYPGSSYDDIIQALSVYAQAASTRLTFPEGSTAIAIAQKMEQAGLCTAQEFLQVANTGDFSQFGFWSHLQHDPDVFMPCEGYLFPDTYEFLNEGSVYDYVATFYARFDSMIGEDIYTELQAQSLTLAQLVTLASFVQEEAGNSQNSNVAQVFRNRLAQGSPYPRLESNASSYIQSDGDNNYLWNWVAPYYGGWQNIPQNILQAYDTYQRAGLPAGPISNPGIEAIRAALCPQPDPEAADCYFFVTDLTGRYYYARTLAEHNANCEQAWAVNRSLR